MAQNVLSLAKSIIRKIWVRISLIVSGDFT